MKTRKPICAASFAASAVLALLPLNGCGDTSGAHAIDHLSPVYTVDREYRSMMGPSSVQTVAFAEAESDPPELLWVTGYRAVMVGPDGESEMPQEFMCHSNLDFNSVRHANLFDIPVYHTGRLFTLSQGQQQIGLPPGFGLPYWSDETFDLTTQVLNLNPDGAVHEVRHRVTIEYQRDVELEDEMKPLFMTSAWGLVLLEGTDGVYGESPDEEDHGPSCLPGELAGFDKYEDEFGRKFAGHWVVQPGREVNHTLVTKLMNLPYDTTIHYIAVHLHPFAESLELVDLTAGETVFKSDAEGYDDKIGLSRVRYYSSEEGIPVFADHQYELISSYNNNSDAEQDSMAVMLMYMHDKQFEKKERKGLMPRVAHVELPARIDDDLVVLHTNKGDITIALYPDAAPRHVQQVLHLVRSRVYDRTPFSRVEPGFMIQLGYPQYRSGEPLTDEQLARLIPLRAEFNDLKHKRGAVSMALNDNSDPHSGVASFFIALEDVPHLDGMYTQFGKVVDGFDTLDRIAGAPLDGTEPVEPQLIESAEVVKRSERVARN